MIKWPEENKCPVCDRGRLLMNKSTFEQYQPSMYCCDNCKNEMQVHAYNVRKETIEECKRLNPEVKNSSGWGESKPHSTVEGGKVDHESWCRYYMNKNKCNCGMVKPSQGQWLDKSHADLVVRFMSGIYGFTHEQATLISDYIIATRGDDCQGDHK